MSNLYAAGKCALLMDSSDAAIIDGTERAASQHAQERKEQRYGFSFDKLAADYADKVAAASSETEYRALFEPLLSNRTQPTAPSRLSC